MMFSKEKKTIINNTTSKLTLKRTAFIFACALLFVSFSGYAQTRAELEERRKAIQKEIKEINAILFKSQKKEKNLLSQLNDLNKRINTREELIRTINKETKQLEVEIRENEKQEAEMTNHLKILKDEYAEMVRKSYKSKSKQSRMMFLLSSGSFLQAFKRFQYISQYTDYREKQGQEIIAETVKIHSLNEYLKQQKLDKESLLQENEKETESIKKEKVSQEQLVKSIKKKEKSYIAQIKKKQSEEKNLDNQINKLIREAIAKSNKSNNLKSSSFALTPEAKLLGKDFVSNKGSLPSPVERGVVVRKYGTQPHPTLRGIVIKSNGVQYATEKGALARSIFSGKVMAILAQPGNKRTVLVQHGNYISAYKNLDNVKVKNGDKINTKQALGQIHTDATTGKTILAFSLFKESTLINPETWVYKI